MRALWNCDEYTILGKDMLETNHMKRNVIWLIAKGGHHQ